MNAECLPLALLDEIECGLVVCDADASIRFANATARHELHAGGLLARRADRLHPAHPAGAADLSAALQRAVSRGRRSLVCLAVGRERLMLSVLPLDAADDGAPQVLVMFGRRRVCSELALELLAASHGLTGAERRVLAALVRPATPRAIAAEFGVALSTVRTQVASLRAKLGASSIEGVLLRMAELPPMASALRLASAAAVPQGQAGPRWRAVA